nr:483_t:CDS:10 [Entrophospora candida]
MSYPDNNQDNFYENLMNPQIDTVNVTTSNISTLSSSSPSIISNPSNITISGNNYPSIVPINFDTSIFTISEDNNNISDASSQLLLNPIIQQQQPYSTTTVQSSSHDISNTPLSMNPLSNLGGFIGGGLVSMNSESDSGTTIPPPSLSGVTSNFPGLYSSTGFDLLGVLARVVSRKDPRINIGPVDMSCSFLVVDARKFDFPIVYASFTFEKLTGYSNAEIVGRNCRFLQSPDGRVQLGSRRRYTDNSAVFHIKSHMVVGQECQASIINYRKGGQPFINLVTVIPIGWESDDIAYFVGFQVDLVEQPNAILEKMKDGTYVVNYSMTNFPPYVPPNSSATNFAGDIEDFLHDLTLNNPSSSSINLTVPFPASSEVYDLIRAHTECSKRLWNQMLLEYNDDFIHVLSLKGIFQYSSPSCRRILEYEPEELINKSLSTICHPSDIVPVMRELKESSSGIEAVNLVYRIRRKNSGYMWFEANGKLHLEQGKGRKCVFLSGRERPVYKLRWRDLISPQQINFGMTSSSISTTSNDPIISTPLPPQQKQQQLLSLSSNEQDVWSKLSLDGLYLYVSSTCQNVLGLMPEEIVGNSLYNYVRSDRTTDITRSLNHAKNGLSNGLKHHMQKKNGQFIEVISYFYPGDYSTSNNNTVGSRPTFIICQTGEITNDGSGAVVGSGKRRQSPPLSNSPDDNVIATSSTAGGGSSSTTTHIVTHQRNIAVDHQPDDNIFEELDTTRSTSWQYELHQMRLTNKKLREELEAIKHSKKKRVIRSSKSAFK